MIDGVDAREFQPQEEDNQIVFDLRDLSTYAFRLQHYSKHQPSADFELENVQKRMYLLTNEQVIKEHFPSLLDITADLINCSPLAPEIVTAAKQFSLQHLDKIKQFAQQQLTMGPDESFYRSSDLLHVLKIYKELGTAIIPYPDYHSLLRSGFEIIESEFSRFPHSSSVDEYLELALLSYDKDLVDRAKYLVHQTVDAEIPVRNDNINYDHFLTRLLQSDDFLLQDLGYEILREAVESTGPANSFHFLYKFRWRESEKPERQNYFIFENLLQMKRMEVKRKGTVYSLGNDYHLASFARYPLDLLIRQYEVWFREGEPKKKQHIVIGFASTDHNGAFARNKELQELYEKYKDKLDIFVFEWANAEQLEEMVDEMEKRFGTAESLHTVVHGSDQAFYPTSLEKVTAEELGTWDGILEKFIPTSLGEKITKLVAPGGHIILDSCSTGAMNIAHREADKGKEPMQGPADPIARILSLVTHRKTFSPQSPAGIKQYETHETRRKVTLRPHYVADYGMKPIPASVFENGKLIEEYI